MAKRGRRRRNPAGLGPKLLFPTRPQHLVELDELWRSSSAVTFRMSATRETTYRSRKIVSKLQDWLARAAVELGLRVELDHALQLSGGHRVIAEAFFPDLGTPNGIAVVSDLHPAETIEELHRRGYAASVLSEPHDTEEYDLQGYAEMFTEWGWGSETTDRPAWMDEFDK